MCFRFAWKIQKDILTPYIDLFFDNIVSIFRNRPNKIFEAFYDNLFPHDPENESVLIKTRELLAGTDDKEMILKRRVKETLDDLERAKRARACQLAASAAVSL